MKDNMAQDTQPKPEDDLLASVKADYEQYYGYIKPYRTKWDKYWKLWNNTRIKKQYYGDTDSFEPMTFQMVEAGTDNVYGSRPKLTFLPTRVEQETDTKILNGLFDYSWDKANMDEKIIPWGREIKITGNGCLFPSWEDGFMNVIHISIRDCILDISATKPENMRFAGYRRLDSVENLKKAKYYDPLAADGEGAWVARYKNLEDITTWTAGQDDKTDKALKDCYAGSTLSESGKKGQLEIILMMYKDKFIEVANRDTIIATFDNPYKMDSREVEVQLHNEQGEKMYDENSAAGLDPSMAQEDVAQKLAPAKTNITLPAIESFIPVVLQRRYVDPALLIGKGDVEPFASTQEDLNDSLNIKKDNLAYNVQNVAVIDSQAKDAIPQLAVAKPGSIIAIKGLSQGNAFHWLEKPDMSGAADGEIMRAKQSIRDTARIDQAMQGVTNTNNRTATEVNAQVAGASAGFNTETKNLEAGAYKQLGDIFLKMVQVFLTQEQLVRVIGKDGVEFKQFDPEKYWGEYDVKVMLESTAMAQQKADGDQALNMMKLFQGDPDFNQQELKKLVMQKTFKMDADELDLIMNPNPGNAAMSGGAPVGDASMGTGAPAGMPQGAPMPPDPSMSPSPTAVTSQGGLVHESADLIKLYQLASDRPEVQNQILDMLGIQHEDTPPASLVQTAQDLSHKDLKMQMELAKHDQAMAQPQQPTQGTPVNG